MSGTRVRDDDSHVTVRSWCRIGLAVAWGLFASMWAAGSLSAGTDTALGDTETGTATSVVDIASVGDVVETAIVDGQWKNVVSLLQAADGDGDPDSSSGVRRLLKGHACLALNRNNESLCLFLGASDSLSLRQWDTWTKYFLSRHPAVWTAVYLRADALARRRELSEALALLDELTDPATSEPLLQNARGVILAFLGQTGPARVALEAAIRSDGAPLADAYANIGALRIQTREGPEQALRAFNQALQLSPQFAVALHGRACIELLSSQMEEANRDFQEADSLVICPAGLVLFAENAVQIGAYMRGLTEQELLAELSDARAPEKAGTTMGTRYEKSVRALEQWNAKPNPTQRDWNRVAENVGALSPSERAELSSLPVMANIANDPVKMEKVRIQSSHSIGYNAIDEPRNANAFRAATQVAAGTIDGLGANMKAKPAWVPMLTSGVKAFGDGVKSTLDSWSKNAIDGSKTMQELLPVRNSCVPDATPGGVDSNWRTATIEDGDWPFRPFFGLLYKE